MPTYGSPGNADALSPTLKSTWNDIIAANYQSLSGLHSRFFSIDHSSIQNPAEASAAWFGDPAEPAFCLDEDWARRLSDWGVRGRHQLHNEYCEYVVKYERDTSGVLRPREVHVTTELREFWMLMAVEDPALLQATAASVLGFVPSWQELYGGDPNTWDATARKVAFANQVAGHGNDQELINHGVSAQPLGMLNRANALFMSHPINGLDDLLYIVLFGAQPYARSGGAGALLPATKEQIFRAFQVEHLACRHADPAAATAAHQQAFNGRSVAFADPLGVYIVNFTQSVFHYQGTEIPAGWVRYSRGDGPGRFQRLEFGAPAGSGIFLDEIDVLDGAGSRKLTGGYDVARHLEVGPRLLIGPSTPVQPAEFQVLTTSTSPINCSGAAVCAAIKALRADFEAAMPLVRLAPRTMGRI
ncbi:MAG: hypothetical protein F9K16_00440 [Thermoanaerobaculia bacterium]|nr:MAG: hypothetical protein F9K16_00440 [Thermoanaerobaculia bacterium]MBZ0101158.1 hypothetical protein [Thermoanaerobaculia bacterium]